MKKQILFFSWLVGGLLLSPLAHAGVAEYSTVSGYVLSWDTKQVVVFSKGYKLSVPRQAFGTMALRQGAYIPSVTYKVSDVPGWEEAVKSSNSKRARKPASKRRPASIAW